MKAVSERGWKWRKASSGNPKSLGFCVQIRQPAFMPTVYDELHLLRVINGMSKEEVEDRVNEALERTGIAYLEI